MVASCGFDPHHPYQFFYKEIKMKERTAEMLKARINILKHRNKDNYRIIQKLQRELDKMSH